MAHDYGIAKSGTMAALKSSPPVLVTGLTLFGVSVADTIQWLTLIYLLMMISHKGWQMYVFGKK